MSDQLTDEAIRRIVREELSASSPQSSSRGTPTTLFRRTQNLIRNAAQMDVGSSASSATTPNYASRLEEPDESQSTPSIVLAHHSQQPGPSRGRKSTPGHPWRIKSSGKAKVPKSVQSKLVYLWVLDSAGENSNEDFTFHDDMVLMKGYVSLTSEMDSGAINLVILELIKTKYPLVTTFEYIKREKNMLFIPSVPVDWEWGFANVKALLGQGKLYVRLKGEPLKKRNSIDQYLGDDYEQTSPKQASPLHVSPPVSPPAVVSDLPPSSSPIAVQDNDPGLETLVNELLQNQEKQEGMKFNSIKEFFEFTSSKINSEEKVRRRVKHGECLIEAFELLKSGVDLTQKLVITFKGEPGIDTGGLLRQFFSNCFLEMCCMDGDISLLFEGGETSKYPVADPSMTLSGIMEMVGKIMGYALVQSESGVQFLSESVYEYLASGDINRMLEKFSFEDCNSELLMEMNRKIMSATTDAELKVIYESDDFQDAYSDTGMREMLNMESRQRVLQVFVYHYMIVKRIPALQQIRKGLEIYQLLPLIERNKELLKPLFCCTKIISADVVFSAIKFDDDDEYIFKSFNFFKRYIESADSDILQKFMVFCTGSSSVLVQRKIKVSFSQTSGFSSSTCLYTLEIPEFEDELDFKNCFHAVLQQDRSFTMI